MTMLRKRLYDLLRLAIPLSFGIAVPLTTAGATDVRSQTLREISGTAAFQPAAAVPGTITCRDTNAQPAVNRTMFGYYLGQGTSGVDFNLISHLALFAGEAYYSGGVQLDVPSFSGRPEWYDAINAAHRKGARVVLTVINSDGSGTLQFSGPMVTELVRDAARRQALIDRLLSVVQDNCLDGVSVDFESPPPSDRDNLTAFVRELSSALKAANPEYHVSFATPAYDWPAYSPPYTPAFDYAGIAGVSDALLMMQYAYTGPYSTSAGPQAPLETAGGISVLHSLQNEYLYPSAPRVGVSAAELVLLMPFYGQQWYVADASAAQSPGAATLGARATPTISANVNLAPSARVYDETKDLRGETFHFFQDGSGSWVQGWLDDADSIGKKIDFAIQQGLQGVGVWSLDFGSGYPEVWNTIAQKLGGTAPPPVADSALLAPVSRGQALTVTHGYNDALPGETCTIGSSADHCDNQKYGLDLVPSDTSDMNILAPLPGTIDWVDGGCLGIRTRANLNLNVCHFATFSVSDGDAVARGAVLGTRSTGWIHLSLDDRNNDASMPPVPFNVANTLEGVSFDPGADDVRDQHNGTVFTSTNTGGSPPPPPSGDCARFVSDLNYPDGTTVTPGQTIDKGWRLTNCGTSTWSAGGGYRAVRVSGAYGPNSFDVPQVGGGQTGDLTATITVPSAAGTHRAMYRLQGPSGSFGDTFWVEIVVSAPTTDCARFVADLSYPDGTSVAPGATITKGWRLSNCGNTTWSTSGGFQAVRTAGSYGPPTFAIPAVSPGTSGDLSATITVPATPGTYRATYQLQGPRGAFGDAFWIEIVVTAADCAAYVADLNYPDNTVVAPGQTITKTWRLSNCGNTTWSAAGGFTAVRTAGAYGPASFAIPSVSPGANGDLSASITVPTAPGTYRATYRLQGPRGAFGDPFWVQIVVAASDCASYVADLNYPDNTTVAPGQTITKSWRLRNCGNTTWSAGAGFTAVRTAGGYGPASFGVPTVSAGANGDLSAGITVPTTPGTYRATYRLQGPRGQFGDSFWVQIVVAASDCATYVADLNYPDNTVVSPGQTITKAWRLRNCGNTTWSPGAGFTAVRTAGGYGPASFSIPTVGPGANGDLSANITVPTAPGTYRATYRLQGPRGQFGDSFWVQITVQASTDCARYVADLNYPDNTVVARGATINKRWRLSNCGNTTWGAGFSAVRTAGAYGPGSFGVPTVSPGANGDLSVNMTVPSTPGTYRATYRMQGPRGQFGESFWVQIRVQ